MNEVLQQAYTNIATVTRRVGGGDARQTLVTLFNDIRRQLTMAGQDGVVTVTIAAHVPTRRLLSAKNDEAV